MSNDLSKAIKQKTDAQLRLLEQQATPVVRESSGGSIFIADPNEYSQSLLAGKNITITTAGNTKTINAVMNLLAGSNITISEPDEDGQVTISGTVTDGTILGKTVDIASFSGKDGYVLAYDETSDKFILAEVTIEPVVVKKTISFYVHGTLEVETNAISIIAMEDMEIKQIKCVVGIAPDTNSLILDINKNGSTIYTNQGNRPTIAVSATSATATLPDVVAISAGDIISLDIDQNGGTSLSVSIKCEVI